MEELFEELLKHKLAEVRILTGNFNVRLHDGISITTTTPCRMVRTLKAIRTASNPDVSADDSEGGCRE